MLKNIILWSLGTITTLSLLFFIYLVFVVKISFVNHSKDKSIKVSGVVDSLYSGGVNDLVFVLDNNKNTFYINRALENGMDLKHIQNDLLGKEITLWHAKSKASDGGHMLQLIHKDSIYYTEWEIPLESNN